MHWWVDLWNNWAKMWGYDLWEWGNAADWVGALGTTGAFVFGFYLLDHQRRTAERSQADGFVTWFAWTTNQDADGKCTYEAVIRAQNATDYHVPMAWVIHEYAEKSFARHRFVVDGKDANGLAPRDEGVVRIPGFSDRELPLTLVEIRDASGRFWVRNLQTGEYLGTREALKFQKKKSTCPAV